MIANTSKYRVQDLFPPLATCHRPAWVSPAFTPTTWRGGSTAGATRAAYPPPFRPPRPP